MSLRVGKLNATTSEKYIDLKSNLGEQLLITTDADVEIAFNTNELENYQTYKAYELIPIPNIYGVYTRLYYKTLIGTALIRYWLG